MIFGKAIFDLAAIGAFACFNPLKVVGLHSIIVEKESAYLGIGTHAVAGCAYFFANEVLRFFDLGICMHKDIAVPEGPRNKDGNQSVIPKILIDVSCDEWDQADFRDIILLFGPEQHAVYAVDVFDME